MPPRLALRVDRSRSAAVVSDRPAVASDRPVGGDCHVATGRRLSPPIDGCQPPGRPGGCRLRSAAAASRSARSATVASDRAGSGWPMSGKRPLPGGGETKTKTPTIVGLSRCLDHRTHMLPPLPRLEMVGSSVDCSPTTRRPSPSGRRVGSSEILSRPSQGSLALRPARLLARPCRTFREASAGRLPTSTAPSATGAQTTTPRAGLSPAGSRPRRSHVWLFSVHLTSFRDALPGTFRGGSPAPGDGRAEHRPVPRFCNFAGQACFPDHLELQ